MAFPGFSEEAITWLRNLNENNNREWFLANKHVYESQLKQPLLLLVESLNQRLAAKIPEYVQDDPRKAPFRIYRDTRFSKNKTPYKSHISAAFPRRGMGDKASGFYFQISGKSVGIAGGSYMPPSDSLLAIRTEIAERQQEFARMSAGRKLVSLMGEMQGEQLRRVPKGFSPDHPAVDMLRRKQFYYWTELDVAIATTPLLEKELVKRFEALRPVMLFLDDAVVRMRKSAERQGRFLDF